MRSSGVVTNTREFGVWTEAKLAVLEEYLPRFLDASRSARFTVYVDAFAGEGKGRSRTSGSEFDGSARRAVLAHGTDGKVFDHLRFFERNAAKAQRLQDELRALAPDRDIGALRQSIHAASNARLLTCPSTRCG